MPIPAEPRIYHIVHVDRLSSIISDDHLWCDAEIARRSQSGTAIGMSRIKQRRLKQLTLASHPDLYVGDCVPFYFCPRSIMLYLLYQRNYPELEYRGGQVPIIHLVADLRKVVAWADRYGLRWAFTLSNAGAYYFEDRCDLQQLGEIDWNAVEARDWQNCKDGKQAEFLVERQFAWKLVAQIGVFSHEIYRKSFAAIQSASHRPRIEIRRDWYYK